MIDKLFERFKRTQPWAVRVDPAAIVQARQMIERGFAAGNGKSRENALRHLERYLWGLQQDPLRVLGHPPLGTSDPNVFRYSSDSQVTISVVADLDLATRQLHVVRIIIKTGGHHGR